MAILDAALYGLGAAIALGVGDLGGTVTSRRVGSRRTTGVVVPVTCVIIVSIFLANGAGLPSDLTPLLGAVVMGCLGGAAYFASYAALRAGPITIVIPVIFAYGGLTVLLSVLFLNEQPSPVSIAAAIVATCGVVLAGVVRGGGGIRLVGRGVVFALVALAAISAIAIVGSVVTREVGWLPSLTVARVTNTLIVLATLLILAQRQRRRERMRGFPDAADVTSVPLRQAGLRTMALLVVLAVLDVTGVSLFLLGLQVGPTWLVGLTSSFAPLVGIIGGLALFHERPGRLQWTGIALVLGSGILLAVQ